MDAGAAALGEVGFAAAATAELLAGGAHQGVHIGLRMLGERSGAGEDEAGHLGLAGGEQSDDALFLDEAMCEQLDFFEVAIVEGAHDDPHSALRRPHRLGLAPGSRRADGAADAAVSAGNTGALMAISRYILKTLDGIDRPAIAYPLPNAKNGATTVLDLGANVDCSEHHLLQFAVLGSALDSALKGKENPSVGLLNIGAEAIKGSEMIKKAGDLLRMAANSGDLNFYGNVEGNDIFLGTTDIVVCDGFVGNVALKTSEGLATMVGTFLKEGFSRNIFTRIAGYLAYPVLSSFRKRVDYRRHNGAALLGLRGLVFKSHGSADVLAFEQALNRAYDAAHHNLLDRVQARPHVQLRREAHLEIAHALRLVVLGEFRGDALDRLGRLHHRDRVAEALQVVAEARVTLLVDRLAQPRFGVARQLHAVRAREVDQGRDAQRPVEVHVQVRLRDRRHEFARDL